MQYQKTKHERKETGNKTGPSHQNSSDSGVKELLYSDPTGQQVMSPLSVKEQSSDNEAPHQSILQKTVSQIKNELGGRLDMARYITEKPISSVVISVPPYERKGVTKKSPKTINIGASKEENEYNIKTIKAKRSPPISKTNQIAYIPDDLYVKKVDKGMGDDYIEEQPISFKQKEIFLRSPNAPKRYKDNDFEEEFSNQMSSGRNFEEINDSADTNKRVRQRNSGNTTKMGKTIKDSHRQFKQSWKNAQDSQSPNSKISIVDDDYHIKAKRSPEKSMTYSEVKKIMKKFVKVYNPTKNNHGSLIGATQVTVPGASDDVFNNRHRVLTKMNRLSNILLSKRDKSPGYVEEKADFRSKSRSQSKSRSRSLSRESLERASLKKNRLSLVKQKINLFICLWL